MDGDEFEERLGEIVDGAFISINGFAVRRVLLAVFAFIVSVYAGAAVYGVVSVLQRLSMLMMVILGGVAVAVQRTLPRYDSVEDRSTLISLGFLTTFVLGFAGAVLTVLFRESIVSVTIIPDSVLVILMAVNLFVLSGFRMGVSTFKTMKLIRLFNVLSLGLKPLLLVVFVGGVLLYSSSVYDVWVGVVASSVVTFLVTVGVLIFMTEYNPSLFDLGAGVVRDYFEYVVPAVGSKVLTLFQRFSPFIFMAVFLSPVEAGAFSIGILLTAFIRWPLSGVNQIFPPIATKVYEGGDMDGLDSLYKHTSRLILVGTMVFSVVITLYASELIGVFSEEYVQFALIIPILVMGRIVANGVGSVGLLLLMTDNERAHFVIQSFLTVIAVAVTYFSTIEYGVYGLAFGYSFGFILNNVAEVIALFKLRGIQPFTIRHIAIFVGGVSIFIVLFAVKSVVILPIHVGVTLIVLGAYSWVVYIYVMRQVERDVLSESLSYSRD